MNYKIACPLCQHNLSIKDPKPGKYKPKCSGCGEQFAIVVEAGEPLKIKVGKLAKSVEQSLPDTAAKEKLQPPTTPQVQHQTIEPPKSASSAFEATAIEQSSLPQSSKPSQFEATIEQPAGLGVDHSVMGNASSVEATMQHEGSAPSKPSAGVSRDFSVNEATIEQAPSHASLASSASIPHAAQAPAATSASNATPPAPKPGSGSSSQKSFNSEAKSAPTFVNKLGGYRIVKEIGAGGMGSVYLAKQISLDRSCALKTIQAHWAQNPRVIARFIREAYAAAQLTHHNVVQIYDLGQDGGTNFFSMELVSGGSLDEQLKAKGKLTPKLAATLILQAARGLKFAHDHGMVHRDIKPANLMLTSDGLVKVADMGLVKTPNSDELSNSDEADDQNIMLASARSHVTAVGSSMGTPAYMSPEQSADAASVDKRADIYSLGCTFYALLTGKPPFDGNTLLEVITKHRTEKIVRPERIISGLPSALGDVIEKMTEKDPNDRYQDLEDVIHDLEVYLELREDTSNAKIIHHPSDADEVASADASGTGKSSEAKVAPIQIHADISAEHTGQLQLAAKRFNSSPLILARRFAPLAWYGLCALMATVSLLFAIAAGFSLIGEGAKSIASQASSAIQGIGGDAAATNPVAVPAQPVASKAGQLFSSMVSQLKSTVGYVLALLIAPVAAIAFAGYERRSPLAQRWRESFIAGGVIEWAFWIVGSLVSLLAAYYLGLWLPLLLAVIFGTAAGAGFYYGIEKSLSKARKPAIDQAQSTLRQLRLKGLDEQSVRNAAALQAGKNWEEFFEALFGYDTMRTMRARLIQSNRTDLNVYCPRRDKLIDQWEQKLTDSRRQRDEKILCKAEKAELVAAGVSDGEAAKRAEAMAASMVDAASETRQAMHDIEAGKLTAHAAEAKRQRIKQMMLEARSGKVSKREVRSRSLDRLLGQLLGSKFRFACAALLLLATGMWVQTNQKALESYWQQAQSTAQSTMDALKKTTLDAEGLKSATSAITTATEQTKTAIVQSPKQEWKSVWFGLVRERNVLFVAIAGMLMLWGTLMSGWKKSLILVPIAVLMCIAPLFF